MHVNPDTELDVRIDSVGAQGDGVAESPAGRLFVPFTAPGDRARVRLGPVRREGRVAEVVALLEPALARVAPPCPHFGECGGCDLQHWRGDEVLLWKRAQVAAALAHRGLDVAVEPVVATPPGERRRARLAVRREADRVVLGFRARGTHRVVDVVECLVLAPALVGLLPALRELSRSLLTVGAELVLEVTATDGGVDLLIERSHPLRIDLQAAMAQFARAHGVARVAWRADTEAEAELVVKLGSPAIEFGGVPVEIPAGTFLQASPAAEAALATEVLAAATGAKRVVDLYAGCGAFALPLAKLGSVHAVEGNAAAAAALERAVRQAGARVTVEHRDLDRRPLQGDDLRRIDIAVLDPPRVGARPQAEALAKSAVPVVVYVSCNPATFARDARILVDGGYRLQRVLPVDQFLWSAHVELAGTFRRPGRRRAAF